MTDAHWHLHAHSAALSAAVAQSVQARLAAAIHARGSARAAFPGGKTPVPVFGVLARAPLDWTRLTLLPTDDRLVSPDSPLSNMALLAGFFAPLGVTLMPLAGGEADCHPAGRAADARLAQLPWPLDLVWLGMGQDGHTASIFAGPDLEAALAAPDGCRAIGVVPDPLPAEAPVARVTLTRTAIVSARAVLIMITGDSKRALLASALQAGAQSAYPVGRVLAGHGSTLDIHWCP